MQHMGITPWRNLNDLVGVRDDIFSTPGNAKLSDDEEARQKQRQATHLISAWMMRGKLAHSVHSTGLLMEALFNHRDPHSSSFNIQAVYATAFSRFVTGFCDMSMANKVRLNMHQAAVNIGMPAEWVDIRHDIAHGSQPRTSTLESVTLEALTWLWDNFWIKLETAKEGDDLTHIYYDGSSRIDGLASDRQRLDQPDSESGSKRHLISPNELESSITPDSISEELLKFVRSRIAEISVGEDSPPDESSTANIAYVLINTCLDKPERLERLTAELLKPRFMIPQERKAGDTMEGAFLIWSPLISTLCKYQDNFISILVDRMVSLLAEPELINGLSAPSRETIYEWVLKLVSTSRSCVGKSSGTKQNTDKASEEVRTIAVRQCILRPKSYWIHKLLSELVEQGTDAFQRRWQRYVK